MADDDYSGFTQDQPVSEGDGGLGQYKSTFSAAEQRYGLPSNLLTAISMQENVNPRHNNPLGLSDDSGVKTFAPDEANAAIYRQAELLTNPSGPYARYARTRDIDDLAAVYSPVGARNDPYGTNVTEASGIKANLAKLGSGIDDYSGFTEDHDYSGFTPDVKKDEYAGMGSEILPANHPQVQSGWTPGQTIKAIWDVAKAQDANAAYGLAKQQSLQGPQGPKQAQVPDDYDAQIRQVQDSPYLSPEDKQKNIAVLREQQTRERDSAFLSLPDYQKKALQTAQQVQKDNPQGWEKAVGSVGPYLKTMAGGPLAPIIAAQQATAETYGNSLDDNVKTVKKNHPEYDDSKALTEALEVANKDAQASGIATLATAGIDIPAAGPLIKRIVQKIGVGAATMEVANTLAQVQRNIATKEHVDPNKEWFDGLNDLWFHVQNLATGAVFAGPHALGDIGRPSADHISDRVPIAEVPETPKTEEPVKEEPTEQPKPQEPSGLYGAYEKLKQEQGGLSAVSIGKLAKEMGVEPTELHKTLLEEAKAGRADLHPTTLLDTELSEDQKYGRFNVPGKEEPVTTVTLRPTETAPPESPQPVPETEPWLSSIANRYTQERQARGEMGEVTPSQGVTPQEMVQKGLAMGPEQIAQHVSDLMSGKGDIAKQAAAVRAREAQLSEESRRLSRISEANPNDPGAKVAAEQAFDALTDFHKGPIAKLKEKWHQAGEAMQGELPVDLSTFNGLREAWLRDVGKAPDKTVEETMRNTARKVRQAVAAEDIAMRRLSQEVSKPTRTRLPTPEEVRDNIMARMKDDPCLA